MKHLEMRLGLTNRQQKKKQRINSVGMRILLATLTHIVTINHIKDDDLQQPGEDIKREKVRRRQPEEKVHQEENIKEKEKVHQEENIKEKEKVQQEKENIKKEKVHPEENIKKEKVLPGENIKKEDTIKLNLLYAMDTIFH